MDLDIWDCLLNSLLFANLNVQVGLKPTEGSAWKPSYLIISQEVPGLEGEEQWHVVVQGVFTVDIIGLVLQQPACLVQHPIWTVNSNHRLSQVIFDMHCYVQLSPFPLRPFTIVFIILS